MWKDFWSWHKNKKEINERVNPPFFHEREVWWCALGANVGHEQDGKGRSFMRPVLIFKKFKNKTLWALPITTRIRNDKFHAKITLQDTLERRVILSQLRTIDAKRLREKIEMISEYEYAQITKAVIALIVQ